ncbi:MAG TPA: succinate dehydrogenase, hydrophobic membrane anchor protein [Gammaproteobacteria bacterium]|jgi:succinate dehydrogenase / fumarate reductase membrane anchor subunit
MSFKSPLNQVMGLGSAGGGTHHWWHQRLTAVAMVPLGLWFAFSLIGIDLGSREALVSWIGEPLTAVLLSLTSACLIYHSWLGISVVVEDYVGGKGAKIVCLTTSSLAHAFLLAVCLFSILKIALGAG